MAGTVTRSVGRRVSIRQSVESPKESTDVSGKDKTATMESAKKAFDFEAERQNYISLLTRCLEAKDVQLTNMRGLQADNHNDRRNTMDQAFRDVATKVVITTKNKVKLETLIKMSITACELDIATPTIPVLLLSDIFDYLTLDKCEELFEFVECHVDTWKKELFFNSTKNNLLRMCNDLLRRLSRSQNTVFCGRILLFLAKFFPLSERSGLNIVSEFNLDNSTVFGSQDTSVETEHDDAMDIGESSEIKNAVNVDYNLYRKFWSLQEAFRNPAQSYNKLFWRTFAAHSDEVLKAFGSFKLDDMKSAHSQLDPALSQEMGKHVYFAKYLTNLKLLELQLSDTNFRRYILVQFLILFQYLTSTVKYKLESYILTEDQSLWIKNTTEKIYKLLEETPPDGAKFAKSIEHALKREEHWNHWKNEGCPEFKTHIVENVDKKPVRPQKMKRKLGDEIRVAVANKKCLLGNPELTRLWNLCPDNMEACRSQKRDFLPSLESFFAEAIEQTDPANLIEDEFKHVKNSSYGWRALRLLARRSSHFFTPSNHAISELPLYLETMIKKLAKELPQQPAYEDNKHEVSADAGEQSEDDELMKNGEDAGQGKDGESMSDQVVTSEQLQTVAERLESDWKKLAPFLGCDEEEIAGFESDGSSDVDRSRAMLISWLERLGDYATSAALSKCLVEANMVEISTILLDKDEED